MHSLFAYTTSITIINWKAHQFSLHKIFGISIFEHPITQTLLKLKLSLFDDPEKLKWNRRQTVGTRSLISLRCQAARHQYLWLQMLPSEVKRSFFMEIFQQGFDATPIYYQFRKCFQILLAKTLLLKFIIIQFSSHSIK